MFWLRRAKTSHGERLLAPVGPRHGGELMSLYRAAKAVSVAGATSVVALSVVLASGAIGAPTVTHGLLAAPVLPLPGTPGYPPKLDGPAVASQEILPNLVAEFPGIPVTAADPGFPAVRQATIGGATHNLLFFDSAFKNAGPRARAGPGPPRQHKHPGHVGRSVHRNSGTARSRCDPTSVRSATSTRPALACHTFTGTTSARRCTPCIRRGTSVSFAARTNRASACPSFPPIGRTTADIQIPPS